MIKNFKELVTSVDVLNTINGGVSEPFLSLREQANSREIHIRVPGIDKEALQIELNNNTLSIFYTIAIDSAGKVIYLPRIIYNQTIPYFIQIAGIKASYEGRELIVHLPFNELRNGYNRKLEIDEQ
jgi:HSP20 family molecular chaperone IbpA